MRHAFRAVTQIFMLIAGFCLLVGVPGRAQDLDPSQPPDQAPDRGFNPAGTYAIGEIETVSPTTGVVSLSIPVAKLPPGPGGFTYGLNLLYSSSILDLMPKRDDYMGVVFDQTYVPSLHGGGWNYGVAYDLWTQVRPYVVTNGCGSAPPYVNKLWKSFFRTPDGHSHLLQLQTTVPTLSYGDFQGDLYYDVDPGGYRTGLCSPPPNFSGTLVYATVDGSYIRVETNTSSQTWVAYLPDGTQVTGPLIRTFDSSFSIDWGAATQITDRNGNAVTITNSCPPAGCVTTITDAQSPSRSIQINHGSGTDTIYWPGNGGQVTTTVNYGQLTADNVTYQCHGTINNQNPQCTWGRVLSVVQSVQTPLIGSGPNPYQFGYAVPAGETNWGELHSVTVPSGAGVTYAYYYDQYSLDHYLNNPGTRPLGTVVNPITSKTVTYNEIRDGVSVPVPPEITGYTRTMPIPETAGNCTVTHPDGTTSQYFSYFIDTNGVTYPGVVSKEVAPDGTTTERIWASRSSLANLQAVDPYVRTEVRSIAGKSEATRFTVDKNGNSMKVEEFDWFDSSTLSTCRSNGVLTCIPTLPVARTTSTVYYAATKAAGDTSPDPYAFWNQGAPNNLRAKESVSVAGSSGTVQAATQYAYDNPLTTANLTQQLRWDSTKGGPYPGDPTSMSLTLSTAIAISASSTYLSNGNVSTSVDANGFVTHTYYDTQNLYPIKRISAEGKAEARTITYSFDSASGLLQSSTDSDNSVTTAYTYDAIGRETAREQTASGLDRWRRTSYDDLGLSVTAAQDRDATNDLLLVSTTYYDPLGRVRLINTGGNKVQKAYRYGTNVSYELTSNPYAATSSNNSEATMGWTLATHDSVGRVVQVDHYSGGTPPAPWGSNSTSTGTVTSTYSGPTTTVTDEASNTHTNYTDSLGRLTSVTEPNNNVTSYTYDAAGNLTGVSLGSQSRTFYYSSLSRLTSATNPESGTVSYQYDNNGNLTTKTDARGVVTCFGNWSNSVCDTSTLGYDGLNRPRQKSYSDGTATVSYAYDQDVHGTLSSVSTSADSTAYTHDKFGRVTGSTQTTAGKAYSFSYNYSLSDQIIQMGYPSNRLVKYILDPSGNTGRVSGVQNAATSASYASIAYTAPGGISTMTLNHGTLPVTETLSWNDRLQETGLSASTTAGSLLGLGFYPCANNGTSCSNNNGNILSETIAVPNAAAISQKYQYDNLNRLTLAAENPSSPSSPACPDASGSWCEQFSYDIPGNRTLVARSTSLPTSLWDVAAFNSATNRIQDAGWLYDSAGNVTKNSASGVTIAYDGENRQAAFCTLDPNGCQNSPGAGRTLYQYDGEGKRVLRTGADGSQTVFAYGADGQLAAEYTTQATTASGCNTCYLTVDHLGSTRLVTDENGNVVERHDYRPFGQELLVSSGSPRFGIPGYGVDNGIRQKFTGQFRDSESGLDYFGARYFSGSQGRFASPDAPFVDQHPEEPQSWNLYTYGRNNPLAYIDPSGQYVCGKSVSTEQCDSFQKSLDQAQTAANALKDKYGADSSQYKQAQAAISAYGGRGDANGVTINVGNTGKYGAITTVANAAGPITEQNKNGQNINVTFNAALLSPDSSMPTLVAHEGSHVAEGSAYVSSGFSPNADPTNRQTETKAYQVQVNIGIGLGWDYQTVSFAGHSPYLLQVRGWPQNNTNNVINGILTQQYTNLDKAAFPRGVVKVTK